MDGLLGLLDGVDLISGLAGSDLGWVGGVLTLVLGGFFGPAAITLFVQLSRLPVIRNVIGGGCEVGGLWFSTCLTNILDKFGGGGAGEKVEDAFEDLFQDVMWKRWKKGMNKDDKN